MTQYEKMTQTPVEKLIISLSIPTIITMLVTNLYNMADTAFVGRLGNSASGAVGIVFGFMSILQAAGFMFGQGSGSIISRSLGKKDEAMAQEIASKGFFSSFFVGCIILIFGFIFLEPLVYLLGSTKTIAPYAKTYISFILLIAPFTISSFTLNNILRYEGKAFFGMAGLFSGAVLNIAGDAFFMFKCNMGIAGAGLSTAISQIISFCILLSAFFTGKTTCKISLKLFLPDLKKILEIAATGISSLFRQGLSSLSAIILNYLAAYYGSLEFNNADAAVAAMSIVSRIFFFMFSISVGVGQGFQPVSGFNYGAEKFDRVKKGFWFTVAFAECLMIILAVTVIPLAPFIVKIFRDDSVVIALASYSLRLHCIALLFLPYCMAVDMLLQSTGKKLAATIVSSLRSGLIFIPSLFALSYLRGMKGIQEAQPVSFILSAIPTAFFGISFFKNLNKQCKRNSLSG